MCVCLGNVDFSLFPLLTYHLRDYYLVCAIGGQHHHHHRIFQSGLSMKNTARTTDGHNGHLSFWLPPFVKLIMLKWYVLSALLK